MVDLTVNIETLDQTKALAADLAACLSEGDCLLLDGTLGAGKSAFSRALIQALAGQEIEVPSPTYTLVQFYPLHPVSVYHYDLYRIGEPDEVFELEWEDAINSSITLVEWPSRLEHLRPSAALSVQISHLALGDEESRLFRFKGEEDRWAKAFKVLTSTYACRPKP